MRAVYLIFSVSIYFRAVFGYLYNVAHKQNLIPSTEQFMIWPNATVPFFVNPEHFDHEQSLKILTALSMFAFKTCLKFAPVMALPSSTDHVMVFVNPMGLRRCEFDTRGHSVYEPHLVTLGYECLNTPHLEMIIMRALGFPFEHNRANRDEHIEVMLENVEPGAIDMFTKDINQPAEFRILPYDINSVTHFGNREFSRNGHRTIIFKDPNTEQNRNGLTATDIRKLEIVYGPECLRRDRQEKIDLCQSYPGVARRKRETEQKDEKQEEDVDINVATVNVRVNPHITPPPTITNANKLKELGIEEQVKNIVENVYKVSEIALSNARTKYCKIEEKANVRSQDDSDENIDVLGIVDLVSDYAKGMVDKAVTNLTEFCEGYESMAVYLRTGCDWTPFDPRCRGNYKSTKFGPVRYSTQHRPVIPQSTKHWSINKNSHLYVPLGRSGNDTVVLEGNNKQDDVELKDGEETGTTEKMENEKSALRIGAMGPPKSRKSLQRHRGAIKKDYEEAKGLAIALDNVQTQRQSAIYNNDDNDEQYYGNKEVIDVNLQSKEETNFKPKIGPKTYDSDNEEGLQLKDEVPTSEEHYESKIVANKKLKPNIYAQKVTHSPNVEINTKKSRFKIKKPEEIRERDRKRHKTMRDRDSKVKSDSEERDNLKGKPYREIGDEAKVPVLKEDYSEDRYAVKKQKKRQKKIRENYSSVYNNREQEPIKEKRTEQLIPKTIPLTKENKEFYKDRKWPGGIVRYVLKTGLGYDENDVRRRIEEVNNILKERTCVRLKEITEEESEKFEDFLVIDDSPDYVTGRVGGKQNFGSVELLQGGQHRQHTAMMVMAMLGFYFEVSRHDRDKYIRVHMRHVRPDKLHHFEKIRSDATLAVPYDYRSATHPAWQFWRQYGRSGISTVATYKETDPDGKLMKTLGQNPELLSETDILKINSIYGVRCFLRTRQKRGRNKPKEKQESNVEKQYEMQYDVAK